MRALLAIAGVACLLLYWCLCKAFDAVQTHNKAGVERVEKGVEEIK